METLYDLDVLEQAGMTDKQFNGYEQWGERMVDLIENGLYPEGAELVEDTERFEDGDQVTRLNEDDFGADFSENVHDLEELKLAVKELDSRIDELKEDVVDTEEGEHDYLTETVEVQEVDHPGVGVYP